MNNTKIIGTIGPSSFDKSILRKMFAEGLNVVRINFSHSDHEKAAQIYQWVQELNEEEKFQAFMNLHSLMLVFQNAYYLELEGTLDDRLKKSLTSTIKGAKDQKGFKYYWSIRKSNFFDEFKKYVDEILLIEEQSVNIYNTIE